MTRLLRIVLLGMLAVLPVFAVACGGDDDDDDNGSSGDATATSEGNGGDGGDAPEGAWTGEWDTGTEVTLEIFVDPAGIAELEEVEEYREAVGYKPVRYARVTATNTTDAVDNGRFATLTDSEGDQLAEDVSTLDFMCARLFRWMPSSGASNEAFAMYTELESGFCLDQYFTGPAIEPGETVTYYLVWEEDAEPEFERVFMGLGQEFEQD